MEDAIGILGREIEIVFAILVGCVRGPHLLGGPGYIVDIQRDVMNGHLAADFVHGQDDIVAHGILTAKIVFGDARVIIMARIHIDAAIIPDMDTGVCGEDLADQRLIQIF